MDQVRDSEYPKHYTFNRAFIKQGQSNKNLLFQDEKIQDIEEMKTMIPPDNKEMKNNVH